MNKSDEDKKRQRLKDKTGEAQAQTLNLPVSFIHLDDMMTYYAQTFAPTRGMFHHTSDPSDKDASNQIITLMNNHAIYAGYYRQILLGMFSLLKYNKGGFHVYWGKDSGPKMNIDGDDNVSFEDVIRWQGNRLESLDMYNLLTDRSVELCKVHSDGEFSGVAMMKSHYWLQKKASEGVYFNVEKVLSDTNNETQAHKYYRSPPIEADMNADDSKGESQEDWASVLAGVDSGTYVGEGYELVEVYIKLNPTEFGLIDGTAQQKRARNRYETWRFTIVNDAYIIEARHMNNVHGHLPHYLGLMNDDAMAESQKSTAEILSPLQEFSSFLLNLHIKANRRNLHGITYYDPTMLDMNEIPDGEVSARVPVKPAARGKDIRSYLHTDSKILDTKQTLGDLDGIMGIINQFFPTQSLPSQIASIDRAVDSQVAAVQHGSNRRQQKSARLIDEVVFRPMRFCMFYNILQYMTQTEKVTDYYTNKEVEINLEEIRNTELPFIIRQGLKAIDRQAVAGNLQDVIFALIQAPQAAQGIDLLGLIDYWTSMLDMDIDMNQFKLEVPPEAAAEGVDEQGNPVKPATSADKIAGGPIFQ